MQVQWSFNANQYEPKQGMEGHPPALKAPFTITNTAIVETKDKTGGMLVVDFTSPMGTVVHRYNINNASPKAVEIAYQQLSALCRAVNVYNIDGMNECAALRGAKGLMDVGYQAGEEPGPNNPNAKGYTELKRVYDLAGNDPSKPGQAQQGGQQGGFQQPQAQPQQQVNQPMVQQPGGSWGQPQGQQQPVNQPAQQQQPQGQPQTWQPSNTGAPAGVPWGPRT